ncbi:MAG: energy transducer TonB [Ignavibacteria bacterium]
MKNNIIILLIVSFVFSFNITKKLFSQDKSLNIDSIENKIFIDKIFICDKKAYMVVSSEGSENREGDLVVKYGENENIFSNIDVRYFANETQYYKGQETDTFIVYCNVGIDTISYLKKDFYFQNIRKYKEIINDETGKLFKEPEVINLNQVISSIRYPKLAKENRIEGEVIANVIIGVDGAIEKAVSLKGPRVLIKEILFKIVNLQYTPALGNSAIPTRCYQSISFNFRLTKKGE